MIFGSRAVTARRRKPRDRQTDRQTEGQTETDRHRQTETDNQRERERGMNIHIVSCTHKFLASRFQLFLSSGIQHGFR